MKLLNETDALMFALLLGALIYFDAKYNCVSLGSWEKLLQECKSSTNNSSEKESNRIRGHLASHSQISNSSDDSPNKKKNDHACRCVNPLSFNVITCDSSNSPIYEY